MLWSSVVIALLLFTVQGRHAQFDGRQQQQQHQLSIDNGGADEINNNNNDEDYQQDVNIDNQQQPFINTRQQVFLPQHLENPPYAMYPSGNVKPKLLDDGKRRGGGLPFNSQASRGGQIDVMAGIRQLNVTYATDVSWMATVNRSSGSSKPLQYGPVAGVSLDQHNNVVIFHRADRVWSERTFNNLDNTFQEKGLGPIKTDTILGIGRSTGELAYGFGGGLFYMPHGITVDGENNVWVTDVALHQVMKLNRATSGNRPLLVLGTEFVPGSGRNTFCKPTSVAVLPSGDFFVADGYCNARIIKFNRVGERILEWGKNTFQGRAYAVAPVNWFAVPHGLTLALDKGLVCVADRENGRVQCFHHSNGTFHSQYHSQLIGDRLFSVAYAPIKGGQLFVVNGPPLNFNVRMEVKGFVVDMASGNVTGKFPGDANYTNPHDVAVTEDGAEVYVVEYEPYRVHKLVSLEKKSEPEGVDRGWPQATDGALSDGAKSSLRGVLIIGMVVILGLLVAGAAGIVMRQKKRGMNGGEDNEDDVEYSRLVQK